jgi:DNA-binding transcriptional LysR family regulator
LAPGCSNKLSHALAEGTLIEPIQALTEKYPKVRLRLSSELTGELINRLLAGELDVAAVLLPEGRTAPPPEEKTRFALRRP